MDSLAVEILDFACDYLKEMLLLSSHRFLYKPAFVLNSVGRQPNSVRNAPVYCLKISQKCHFEYPKKEAKLPTTYEKAEIEGIVKAIDQGNPKGKRDYAIILLAARLGLRASDICGMKFENLLWGQNLIIVTQQKTKKRIARICF